LPRPPAYEEIREEVDSAHHSTYPRDRKRFRTPAATFAMVGAAAVVGSLVGVRGLHMQNVLTRVQASLESHQSTRPMMPSERIRTALRSASAPTIPPIGRTTRAVSPGEHAKAVTGSARRLGQTSTTRAGASGLARAQQPRFLASQRRGMIPAFAWAPIKNAIGYRIEFRLGSRIVLRVRTRRARLRVARARLPQGRYHWLVWRLNHRGTPVGAPIVDATLAMR
jgi:hypothetical protein